MVLEKLSIQDIRKVEYFVLEVMAAVSDALVEGISRSTRFSLSSLDRSDEVWFIRAYREQRLHLRSRLVC